MLCHINIGSVIGVAGMILGLGMELIRELERCVTVVTRSVEVRNFPTRGWLAIEMSGVPGMASGGDRMKGQPLIARLLVDYVRLWIVDM